MRRLLLGVAIALLCAAWAPAAQAAHPAAPGGFGLSEFDLAFTNADGTTATQAGSHPFAMTISLGANLDGEGDPEGWLKDILVEQLPGLLADTTAYGRCSSADFLALDEGLNSCPPDTQLGVNAVAAPGATPGDRIWSAFPVFNLEPPPGVLLRLGFSIGPANVVVDAALSESPPYNAVGASRNVSQLVKVVANELQLWGDPSDPAHDELRGRCALQGANLAAGEEFEFEGDGKACPLGSPNHRPLLTLPTDCSEPLVSSYEAFSWEGEEDFGFVETHDGEGNPQPFTDCAGLPPLKASIDARPSTRAAQSPSGLDFSLDIGDEGLTSVNGRSQSRIRQIEVALPEGVTANPSLAEGLEVCSEEQLEGETLHSAPGAGCPEASKIGALEIESPLLDRPVKGALYVATPHENPFGTLIAFYFVFRDPQLGIIVRQAAKVVPDPRTGQLVTTIPDLPPTAAFSHAHLHLREGGRSPLISPSLCGSYQTRALLTPWSGTDPVPAASSFEIISGPDEGPCPSGGTPPFSPGFEAGSQNNAAGAYSPFSMRLTRRDGDQDLTRFDATLPPGVGAKLAGVSKCSDAQIAHAKARTGTAELASPSCPAASRLGVVFGGAGVGSQLTYVRGSLYLAGPFAGAPISVVGIVPAVAGPFDVGTVVVRDALRVDPRSGVVTLDGARSDPIPHILAGIPLSVRDVQVHVDRPGFSYTPTSCDPFATKASIWGGGGNPFSLLDDSPVSRQARYQAANCQRLGFQPRLSMRLRGGPHRGEFPALRLTYRPRPGDANLAGLSLRFPRSEFIEQGHFRTICTRVQFAAGTGNGAQCPKGSVYGQVSVFTPILSEPLTGPVFLRSSDHNLPDVVFALHGPPSLPIDFEASARIDSIKGGLRAIAAGLPDAPISKAIVAMQGGQKGLFVNSTNICLAKHRATALFTAQSAKQRASRPLLAVRCAGRRGR
jgi:hypothetical protein